MPITTITFGIAISIGQKHNVMKQIACTILFSLALVATACSKQTTASAQEEPFVESQRLYAMGEGSQFWRIPALLCLDDGTLLAVNDRRKYDYHDLPKDIDIVYRRSTDNGKTWTEPQTLIEGQGEGKGYGDPALVQCENGDVLCLFAGHNGYFQSTVANPICVFMCRSTDRGQTWGDTVNLTSVVWDASSGYHGAFVASGNGLRLKQGPHAGRVLFAAAVLRNGQNVSDNFVIYSDDNGHTWQRSQKAFTAGDEAKLMELADIFEAEYVATGHYAFIEKLPNGRYSVRKAAHIAKDQTYMLYKLSQEQLSRTLMPLGKYTKDEVRKIAEEAGLPCAHKEDSQEICFVTEGRYSDFICENTDKPIPAEGNFVDEDGNVLGKHKGIYQYTVGQRKGLGIALGYPAFVTKIDTKNNTVVLGTEAALMCDTFLCREVNFLSIPEMNAGDKVRCLAKARYHQTERPATLEMLEDGRVKVTLDEAVKLCSTMRTAALSAAD